MKLSNAQEIADRLLNALSPYCERIEIAGSIRRRKPDVNDIEIVAIPNPYDIGLFASGIASILELFPVIRGQLPCKYTRRKLPDGIEADFFFAVPENWGLIYAIRTGPADFSHHVLACGWVRNGYNSVNGMLIRDGKTVSIYEESDLFRVARVPWIEPEDRCFNMAHSHSRLNNGECR